MAKIDGQEEAIVHGYVNRVPVLLLCDSSLSVGARLLMIYLSRYVQMKKGKVPEDLFLSFLRKSVEQKWFPEELGGE